MAEEKRKHKQRRKICAPLRKTQKSAKLQYFYKPSQQIPFTIHFPFCLCGKIKRLYKSKVNINTKQANWKGQPEKIDANEKVVRTPKQRS